MDVRIVTLSLFSSISCSSFARKCNALISSMPYSMSKSFKTKVSSTIFTTLFCVLILYLKYIRIVVIRPNEETWLNSCNFSSDLNKKVVKNLISLTKFWVVFFTIMDVLWLFLDYIYTFGLFFSHFSLFYLFIGYFMGFRQHLIFLSNLSNHTLHLYESSLFNDIMYPSDYLIPRRFL